VHSFCKILSASDTSIHGGVLTEPRRHADECLPPLVSLLDLWLDDVSIIIVVGMLFVACGVAVMIFVLVTWSGYEQPASHARACGQGSSWCGMALSTRLQR
jgi:hypothetical protein